MLPFGWIGAIVAAFAVGPGAGGAAGPESGLPGPLVTQRTTFAIPFRVPPAEGPHQKPSGVALFYSRDSGVSWDLYGQVAPEQGHFVFVADAEGEYWFSIQSQDRAGNVWPRFTGIPGLRVRVDTTPPTVTVTARRGEGREVTARWRIDDANLRPDGVSIAYRPVGESQWQDIALGSHHQSRLGVAAVGEVTWWPDPDPRPLEVRVEAVDLASNRSATTATVDPAGAASPDQLTGIPSISTPAPNTPAPDVASPRQAELTGTYGQPWPAQPHPALANRYQPEAATATHDGTATGPRPAVVEPKQALSEPKPVRPVNARLFELEFDVDSADPSTISHVELWGTRDEGRSWRSISLHQRGRSPILAKVDAEGTYGFRIVVHSRMGSSHKPQPGDLPDIWVRVDLTKPVVRIVSAVEGTGPEANHLVITWTAEDEELAEGPISLAWSHRPGGPWTGMARQLPNTGRYAWPLPAGESGPIHLRLEARDAAGNLAEVETTQPVVLERAPPRVHVREVRPLGDTSNGSSPRRYIFR